MILPRAKFTSTKVPSHFTQSCVSLLGLLPPPPTKKYQVADNTFDLHVLLKGINLRELQPGSSDTKRVKSEKVAGDF